MDALRLNPQFYPIALVEGWNSFIWAERYSDAGDFQIDTNDVKGGRTLLPEGSLLGIRQSSEVMIVESNEIPAVSDEKGAHLTIKGRTFETFSENREMLTAFPKLNEEGILKINNMRSDQAIEAILKRRLVSPPAANADDIVPGIVVNNAVDNEWEPPNN